VCTLGANGQISNERNARLELERQMQRTNNQVESMQRQHAQDAEAMHRRLAEVEAQLEQEAKLREDTEQSMAAQQKMAANRQVELRQCVHKIRTSVGFKRTLMYAYTGCILADSKRR
jgi:hypothetical protein